MKSICLLAVAFGLASAVPTIDDKAVQDILANGKATVILHFNGESVSEVRARFHADHRPLERSVQPDILPAMLMENANKAQAGTLKFFAQRQEGKAAGSSTFQLWALNQLIVHDADMDLLEELKKSDEISHIEADRERQLIDAVMDRAQEQTTDEPHLIDVQQQKNEWGVDRVGAPQVWAKGFYGQGVCVGIIDTGVRRTHETLKHNYRAQYGFYDATWTSMVSPRPETESFDDQGHGTHCAGSAVGGLGVGVAPNATWIACKGLDARGSGSDSSLRKCGQFMLCPWKGRNEKDTNCNMRPQVISNSWGTNKPDRFYDDIIGHWISAGQTVIFAAGNSGSDCETVGSPADDTRCIAVGATDSEDTVADFSSRGPKQKADGEIRPDVSAPGKSIRSGYWMSDTQYMTLDGTSMATPHVAGIAALYLSKNRGLTHYQVKDMLQKGAKPTKSTGKACGPKGRQQIPDTVYPNNHVGSGLTWAPAAF